MRKYLAAGAYTVFFGLMALGLGQVTLMLGGDFFHSVIIVLISGLYMTSIKAFSKD